MESRAPCLFLRIGVSLRLDKVSSRRRDSVMDDTRFKALVPQDAMYVKKLRPEDLRGTDIDIARHPYGIFSADGCIKQVSETEQGAVCTVRIQGRIVLTLH